MFRKETRPRLAGQNCLLQAITILVFAAAFLENSFLSESRQVYLN